MSENKKEQLPAIEIFRNNIITEYVSLNSIEPTEKEKALISGYFIAMDEQLRSVGVQWGELDFPKLKRVLVNKARLGLDMQMDNHLHIFSSKNKMGKVTTFFITGYKGERHIAYTFARTQPLDDVVELIYETDKFQPIKKSSGDDYIFEINEPFNRGKIIGAFGYLKYDDERKNKIACMTYEELLERKPTYAKPEFWGKWEKKMLLKTMAKELYKLVELDADKVRLYKKEFGSEKADLLEMQQDEARQIAHEETGQGEVIDIDVE